VLTSVRDRQKGPGAPRRSRPGRREHRQPVRPARWHHRQGRSPISARAPAKIRSCLRHPQRRQYLHRARPEQSHRRASPISTTQVDVTFPRPPGRRRPTRLKASGGDNHLSNGNSRNCDDLAHCCEASIPVTDQAGAPFLSAPKTGLVDL